VNSDDYQRRVQFKNSRGSFSEEYFERRDVEVSEKKVTDTTPKPEIEGERFGGPNNINGGVLSACATEQGFPAIFFLSNKSWMCSISFKSSMK
jgi:hypothetical protein